MAPKALSFPFVHLLLAGSLLMAGCGKEDGENENTNTAPIADAGGAQTLTSSEPVSLSGSGSYDPDGDPITFHWAMDSAPEGSALQDSDSVFRINDERDPTTTFTPDAEGTFVVSLVVVDGRGLFSTPDRTTITINSGDAPVADAGDDQSALVTETITVDGSDSWDGLGRDLSYEWSFAQVPETSTLFELADDDSAVATFVPDVSGVYLVALVVDNGLQSSSPDTIVVRVTATDSDAPVADAGDDIEGNDCTDIALDGSASYDPNGEPLTYLWDIEEQPADSSATIDSFADSSEGTTSFYPDVDGEYVLSLAVHDGLGWSIPDPVTLTIDDRSYNSPAAINPGLSQEYDAGEAICEPSGSGFACGRCDGKTISLGSDAVVNDPDGDNLEYTWEVVSGSASIPSPHSLSTTAVAHNSQPTMPDACASNSYTFRLTVKDCPGQETSQTVTHTVNCCGFLAE